MGFCDSLRSSHSGSAGRRDKEATASMKESDMALWMRSER